MRIKLDDIEGELQQGVALSLYQSRPQRLRRITATTLLTLKHTLRGVLFSWPLYLLGFGGFVLPLDDALSLSLNGAWNGAWSGVWLLPLLLLPGLIVSFSILKKGIQEDYRSSIHRTLLDWQDVRQLLKKGAP